MPTDPLAHLLPDADPFSLPQWEEAPPPGPDTPPEPARPDAGPSGEGAAVATEVSATSSPPTPEPAAPAAAAAPPEPPAAAEPSMLFGPPEAAEIAEPPEPPQPQSEVPSGPPAAPSESQEIDAAPSAGQPETPWAALPVESAPRRPVRRRRRSWGGPLLALVVILLFATLLGALYLLTSGRALTTDGRVVAAGDQPGGGRRVNEPPAGAAGRPDPVMGNLPDRTDRPRPGRRRGARRSDLPPAPTVPAEDGRAASEPPGGSSMEAAAQQPADPPPSPAMRDDAEPAEPPGDAAEMDAAGQPQLADTENGETMQRADAAEPAAAASKEPSMESEADDESSLDDSATANGPPEELLALLRSGNFPGMLSAAETIQAAAETPAERRASVPYVRLAELAEYYDEGIRRGTAKLGAGETFELAAGIEVIVVEVTDERIALKINGRVRRYPFDGLPLVLAHRLAEFGLPTDDPVAQAGRAAYQLLWPSGTGGHRQQALDWWGALPSAAGLPTTAEIREAAARLFD